MSGRVRSKPDVLVIGTGPAGLAMACALLAQGISVRITEKRPGPLNTPRALLLWPRTFDVLAEFGVERRAFDPAIRIHRYRCYSDRTHLMCVEFPPELRHFPPVGPAGHRGYPYRHDHRR
ncbi:FAD-dependent oxidoreductase [Nocardia acidivorans]|uniref:FAD-dependent oxidoreductase n=1 Tax=Nocardia acidivorans TaxID=404580 RepID=UPI000831307A|nr:FAD-dependent monooxygenase [Nocardia acidivorans]